MAQQPSGQQRLSIALDEFQKQLTPVEQTNLSRISQPDVTTVTTFSAQINESSNLRRKRLGDKIQPFLLFMHSFGDVVGIYIQSDPRVSALVWGSIKLVVQIATNYFDYFVKITDLFVKIQHLCPTIDRIGKLFQGSAKLQDAVLGFYTIIIEFCTRAFRFLRQRGLKQFSKAIWKPFKAQFEDVEGQLEEQRRIIDDEVLIASQTAAHDAAQSALIYQMDGYKHRQFQVDQWARNRDWQMQQDRISRDDILRPENGYWNYLPSRIGTDPKSPVFYGITEFTSESLCYRTMLSSLLKQLAVLSQAVTTVLGDKLEAAYTNTQFPPHVRKIEELFILFAESLGPIYIFLDGIDECTVADRIELLSCFGRLLQAKPNDISIALSSRPEIDIPRTLEIAHEISLESITHRPDLEAYIADELQTKCANIRAYSSELKTEIKTALLNGADGMFLWVFYQIDDIRNANNKIKIRELLRNLPRGLRETYERIAGKIIKDRDAEEAIRVFQWLSHCRRPLTLTELMDAISIRMGDKQHANIRDRYSDDTLGIVHNCCNLVILNNTDDTVQYAHSTAAKYLASCENLLSMLPPDFDAKQVHELHGMLPSNLCATYLLLGDFETQITRAPAESLTVGMPKNWLSSILPANLGFLSSTLQYLRGYQPSTISKSTMSTPDRVIRRTLVNAKPLDQLYYSYPFLSYVTTYWLDHFKIDVAVLEQYKRDEALECHTKMFAKLLHLNPPFPYLPYMTKTDKPDIKKLLYWACENDHFLMFQATKGYITVDDLQRRMAIEGEEFPAPLFCAARNGNYRIFRHMFEILCRFSTEPGKVGSACEFAGYSPLSIASERGHVAVVKLMLEDFPNFIRHEGNHLWYRRSVSRAAANGHFEMLEEFLTPAKLEWLELSQDKLFLVNAFRHTARCVAYDGKWDIFKFFCDKGLYFENHYVSEFILGYRNIFILKPSGCKHEEYGHEEVLKRLVKDGPEDIFEEILIKFRHDQYAIYPAFLQAIADGNIRVLNIIIAKTVFLPNQKPKDFMNEFKCPCGTVTVRPLVKAVESRHSRSVQWVLEHGDIQRDIFGDALILAHDLFTRGYPFGWTKGEEKKILDYMGTWAESMELRGG
ncbi:hypothetical protein Dda_9049 [Drechslerella dactyloides]|uniref:NACHT domain-containing protein n=1 Tax=Drechslerella dactyloides TaxID=74499 RepID=A0AAD6IPW6_DREDA|nr:hypothetical protein Dda_9049 [Drechslerella dactyloides]